MKLEAAIIEGPHGAFAVLRIAGDQGESLSPDVQRKVKQCFQAKHGPLPVVFLSPQSSQLDLDQDEPVANEVRACLAGIDLGKAGWQAFDYA
ncbi:MAG TPA: hypothetical protein VK324_00325 [Tepidisphaeraceae bacterium]|nr:hypothetical protein [Tepidisphaeraceae bacterium]